MDTPKTDDATQKTDDTTQKTDDTTQKTDDATQKTDDITKKTDDTTKKTVDTPTVDMSSIKDLFNSSNMNAIFWFLAVYFAIIIILAIFFKDKLASMQAFSGQIVDILVFGTLIYYAFYMYYKNKDNENSDFVTYIKDEFRRELSDFNTVIYLGIFLVALMGVTYAYRMVTLSTDAPFSINFLSGVSWIYMCVLLIVNFFIHVLKIPILDTIFQSVVPSSSPDKTSPVADEVFNVSNNLYTYNDAKEICSSFGAKLADYDAIEKAYNNGAEWCNYGWSEGQMALFPTQKDTWSVLQKNKQHANDCGRPGVNGGYMVNPYVKFGVNCFGKKPAASKNDMLRMNAKKMSLNPEPTSPDATTTATKKWDDVTVNAFNQNKWSAY